MNPSDLLNSPFAVVVFFGAMIVGMMVLMKEIRAGKESERPIDGGAKVPNGAVTRLLLENLIELAKENRTINQGSRDFLREMLAHQTQRNEILTKLDATLQRVAENCPAMQQKKDH